MSRLRVLSVAFGFLWFVSICRAQELPTAAPEEVGLSSEKLNRVTSAAMGLVSEHKSAGVITMIARRGKVAYFEATGQRDIDSSQPMERDTICRFYSMTKPVTSVAVMMLVEEGKVELDDLLSKHLPEFS